jgi:6-phosphofructokinase 1
MPDFTISTLGPCTIPSPLLAYRDRSGDSIQFVDDAERMLAKIELAWVEQAVATGEPLPAVELAGPRKHIHFDPARIGIGVVTCGGLCPGLNNVIRAIVMAAEHHYGVRRIYGFRYGFRGLVEPALSVPLTAESVSEIHTAGGTVLGSSRGPQSTVAMVDRLAELDVSALFVIGGDGSMRGALDIAAEVRRRGLDIAIIGVPKTIDNDLKWMDRSFGFQSAYAKAVEAIEGAHREAQGAPNGIGLVKVMGRHSGFIACAATVASGNVNFTLIPEVPFTLDGPGGLLEVLHRRLERRHHAVIVVAEGAGQEHFAGARDERDASGNLKLREIGGFLASRIHAHFGALGFEINLKYIDPSYIIRSVPANAADAVFCAMLGMNAVHAGMCGKTEMMIGSWRHTLVHVPINLAIEERNHVDPTGTLWLSVLGTTGQPLAFQDLPSPTGA